MIARRLLRMDHLETTKARADAVLVFSYTSQEFNTLDIVSSRLVHAGRYADIHNYLALRIDK